jgi:transcriptional regulator with XRE-family HTH domain
MSLDPETQHIINALKRVIRAAGFSNREVERRLGVSASYLSRLFSGNIVLRFDHLVAIGGALGLEPRELFHFIYPHPKDPPSPGAARLRELLSRFYPDGAVLPHYTARTEDDLDQDLEKALWDALQRLTLLVRQLVGPNDLGGAEAPGVGGEQGFPAPAAP